MGVKNSDIQIARNDGIAAWPTVTTFAESPKRPGLLYAGTDDGHLQVSRDGKTWADVIGKVPGLPKDTYVSRVVPSRFDEGTVYATFDGHRQNDFATYIYASNDFGQTWRAVNANLTDEIARTLTEDTRNPDVLYLGTETGLFVSIDRAKSWMRVKANLPTVRIDEITLHPRDNAMILATHGRSIWILDQIAPFQEYAAAQAADAKLYTPPPSVMYRRPATDRNYEFWGDQTFFGENPPQAAVIAWQLKKNVGEVKLTITDALGKPIREISGQVLANSNKAGYQAACWDLRVQPLAAPAGGAGGRAGGGRGGDAAAGPPSPAAAPQATAGQPGQAAGRGGAPAVNPFGAGCSSGGGRGGGGFGGAGGGNPGPFVLPGTYNVSLVVDGKTIESRPLKVVADPDVALTVIERKKLYDMAMEMHELQRVANDFSGALTPLNTRMGEIGKEIASRSDIPQDVKASVDSLTKELAAVVPKFAAGAGGGRGGGGQPAACAYGCCRAGGSSTPARQRRRAHHAGQERHDGRHVADVDDDEGVRRREGAGAEGDGRGERGDRESGDAQRDAGQTQGDAGSAGAREGPGCDGCRDKEVARSFVTSRNLTRQLLVCVLSGRVPDRPVRRSGHAGQGRSPGAAGRRRRSWPWPSRAAWPPSRSTRSTRRRSRSTRPRPSSCRPSSTTCRRRRPSRRRRRSSATSPARRASCRTRRRCTTTCASSPSRRRA